MKLLGIGSTIEIGPWPFEVTWITATTVEARAPGFGPVEASLTPGKEITLTHAEVENGIPTTQKKET